MLAAAVVAVFVVACNDSDGSPPLTPLPSGTIEVFHEGGVIYAELAVTQEERSTGLSNRPSLPADAGMLFVYDAPRRPSFWMRQMLFPLDFVWIGADKRVLQVDADIQPEPGVADTDLQRYSPSVDVQYVLELNAGAAAALGIEPGDQLTFDTNSP